MVTGQPLLIVWKICPSMLVRMKISLVSWIASTETDPKAGGEPPPGTSPWFCTSWQGSFWTNYRPSWSIWPSRQFSSWPWGRASVEVRYMLGKQPSTIDGYRSPIVDKLGNSPFNISKDGNLARLLDRFFRDRPKGRSGIPSWNFLLAVHQLRLHLIQSRRPPWSIWPSRRYSSWPLGRASTKVRFMPGKTDIFIALIHPIQWTIC